jgi:hypothetical protein
MTLSAFHQNIRGQCGVILRGLDWQVELTSGEARILAQRIESQYAVLATELRDAADTVDRFTGFDGPLGEPAEEIEERPGNFERALQLLTTSQPE